MSGCSSLQRRGVAGGRVRSGERAHAWQFSPGLQPRRPDQLRARSQPPDGTGRRTRLHGFDEGGRGIDPNSYSSPHRRSPKRQPPRLGLRSMAAAGPLEVRHCVGRVGHSRKSLGSFGPFEFCVARRGRPSSPTDSASGRLAAEAVTASRACHCQRLEDGRRRQSPLLLPSTRVTRFPRYYEPLRHPRAPGLSLTGVRLVLSSLT